MLHQEQKDDYSSVQIVATVRKWLSLIKNLNRFLR